MSNKRGLGSEVESRLEQRQRSRDIGTLRLGADDAYVGDIITLEGADLPEDDALDVVWHSANGGWGVIADAEIVGPQFHPRQDRITSVEADDGGSFTTEFVVPEDYGGEHRIELRSADGESVAESSLTVTPWFELDRSSAPLGETFQITGYGIGPNAITNNYQVTWDNGMVGFMTGTMNRGTATAEIRAAGPVGDHVIQIWRNVKGVPFLQNNTQSLFGPVAGGRKSVWNVEVTEPEVKPETMWVDPLVRETPLESHYPDLDEETDAELTVTPTSGQPGTTATISGRAFPSETTIDLIWYTHVGNRIAGIPIQPEPLPEVLPTITTDEDGRFDVEVTIPRGSGSTRPIVAEIEGRSVAVTGFVMQPDVVDITPKQGPPGTEIEIELSGIGWPKYENAYYFVYDNRPVGYVCGLESDEGRGVVHTRLRATGEPGYHFIDVYPSFFETKEELPDFTQKVHLSYQDNHPVRPLPALHFTFEVTE